MSETTAPAAPAAEAVPEQHPMTLEEWVRDHSRTSTQVELINAFFRMETLGGRTLATPAEFAQRLAAFAARPVA